MDPPPGLDAPGSGGSPFQATRQLLEALAQSDLLLVAGALEARFGAERAEEGGSPLSWEMLAVMQGEGLTIGSHTMSHAVLTRETPERAREEMAGSRRALRERLGVQVRTSTRVKDIRCGEVELENGEIIRAENILWAAGVSAVPLTKKLGVDLDRAGRLARGREVEAALRNAALWSAGQGGGVVGDAAGA